jgi:hypothetical protein
MKKVVTRLTHIREEPVDMEGVPIQGECRADPDEDDCGWKPVSGA